MNTMENIYNTIKDQDGRPFKTVKIGNQIWMAENLNVSNFRNGQQIPEAETFEAWKSSAEDRKPAWCYYDKNPENGITYGKLYNWYAVNDYRELAPKGWHIPNDDEWKKLIVCLGGEKVAGVKLRDSTFAFLPAGCRSKDGRFHFFLKNGHFWSSTENVSEAAWSLALIYSKSEVHHYLKSLGEGLSCRCVMDY